MIGDFIYGIVKQYSNEKDAPKITGMILDQKFELLIEDVSSLKNLKE